MVHFPCFFDSIQKHTFGKQRLAVFLKVLVFNSSEILKTSSELI